MGGRGHRGRVRVGLWVALVAVVAGVVGCTGGDRGEPARRPAGGGPTTAGPTTSGAAASGDAAVGPGGWRRVEPGGRTRCGRGGRFAFWARMGAPDRLLVFFEGGGGCWDYRTCAAGSRFFDGDVGADDDPSYGAGVLDLDDPRNPFRGWSVLFVPSCTGDVYAGDAVRTYRDGGRSVTVHHRGHANATAALSWVFRRVPDPPRRVFVTGCSAGSIGSILHAPRILRQYPRAQVAQLGDSLGYLFSRPTDLGELWGAGRRLPGWVPEVRAIPPARFTMARFYQAVAAHYPRATFAQVNFADDAVQRFFHEAAGNEPATFARALAGNLAAIRATSPNFRSCVLEGSTHCALPRPEFYSLASGGVALRDWVAAQAEGRPVPNLPPG
jgi:Pectinacetylesterase